jgi:hypothetical protein
MFKDKTVIWLLEYIFGAGFVLAPLTALAFHSLGSTDPYIWAAGLFVVCLGVILISCGSSMRQRLSLARRIDKLAEQLSGLSACQTTGWGTKTKSPQQAAPL